MVKSSFIKKFLPFSALVVGAFVGLAQFRQINYTHRPDQNIELYKEQLKKAGMKEDDYQVLMSGSMKDQYDKLVGKVDIDHWDNKRGPRPWEEANIEERLRREAEERAKSSKK